MGEALLLHVEDQGHPALGVALHLLGPMAPRKSEAYGPKQPPRSLLVHRKFDEGLALQGGLGRLGHAEAFIEDLVADTAVKAGGVDRFHELPGRQVTLQTLVGDPRASLTHRSYKNKKRT